METAALFRPRRSLILPLLLAVAFASALELSDQLMNYVLKDFGQEAHQRLENWQRLHALASNAPVDRQLKLVNSFFNRVRFISDIRHWGEEDYWATPIELLTTNGGDCEDFSIAKYLTLRAMGVPDEQLRIVYVKALELNQAHMVLAWYETPSSDPLVLDNLINEMKPASQRTDLEPVYSFNGDGLWLNKESGNRSRIGDAKKLERWQDLNERLNSALAP
ncbi:transglutaminase-like cysteine peptidase [Marinobacter sp. S0848L]|uniref:transglutaminase-like cysteine peptidase n=1 Tax=Marinobacter sp. S0848L TaxID=2926423 RepID=UPI001FF62AF3|nr:transglutaminase-like cysteine peptidase [Marinobacter sp. S0848L]MCK0107397.1 transglutaminase-like cysteine peptidase [Marinobacter sp. S0848L]